MFMQRILPAAAAVGLMLSAAVAQAATVSLVQTTSGSVTVGDVVSFDIVTDDDFPTFIGFQSLLAYDADVASLTDVRINPGLPVRPTIAEPAGATGMQSIAVGAATLGSLSGRQILASLDFTAVAAGTTSIVFTAFDDDVFVTNRTNDQLFSGPLSASITVTADDTVTPMPAPVPLPASALLLVAGMGGLAALRRRKG